jgi:hypothetical protein
MDKPTRQAVPICKHTHASKKRDASKDQRRPYLSLQRLFTGPPPDL